MEIQINDPFITVLLAIAGVLAYELSHRILSSSQFIRDNFQQEMKSVCKELVRRLSGSIFLGVVPFYSIYFLFRLPVPYLEFPQEWSVSALSWSVGLFCFVLIVPMMAIRQKEHLKIYPQMRIQRWDLSMILLNSVSWGAQLFSYELLFRGILLFATVSAWGEWPAIFINALLYSLAHLPKGWKEALGSFPFAVLLCLTTLSTGSIWPVVFGHITLALTNDMLAVQKNPSMHFDFRLAGHESKE